MFEQSAKLNEYYRELEPAKRRAMLETLCASEPDDGANAYRRTLLDARHVDPKNPGHEVDRMLFMCVSFMQLCQSARMFKGSAIREVRRSLQELRFDQAGAYGEAGTRALYWEIRNAAARYLSTCSAPGKPRLLWPGPFPRRGTAGAHRPGYLADVRGAEQAHRAGGGAGALGPGRAGCLLRDRGKRQGAV